MNIYEQTYSLRPYHNLNHLKQMRRSLEEFTPITERLDLAILYHDLVYEPGSLNNELFSAIVAQHDHPEHAEFLKAAILATKSHIATGDREIDLFLDADMSILASSKDDYWAYVLGIRKEYQAYSDAEFVEGRKAFLKSYKGFITPEFSSKYNESAFTNIAMELECLS